MAINLLPEELRKEKGKQPVIKKEVEMVKPQSFEIPKSPEPVQPLRPPEPPRTPETPKYPPKPFLAPKPLESKPEEKFVPFPFGKPEEIFTAKEGSSTLSQAGPVKKEAPPFGAPSKITGKLEEEWTLPKMGEEAGIGPEVSLAPRKIVILPRMVRTKIIALLVWLMVLLFIFTGAWWWINNQLKGSLQKLGTAQKEIEEVEKEIEPLVGVKEKIAKIEAKFGKAQNVLVNHIYWTKFFELLEKYTVPDVYFNGFSGNTSGSIHLNAVADNLPAVGRQIIVLKEAQDFVQKFEVSNITLTGSGVTFSLELILQPNVFYLGK